MCIDERTTLAFDGVVVLAIDVVRTAALSDIDGATLRCRHRITTRGMWTDNGKLVAGLHRVSVGVSPVRQSLGAEFFHNQ